MSRVLPSLRSPVWLGVAAMAALLWPHRGYVPIWDGRVYAECVLDAAARGLSMETLRCAGHPSQGWALVMALPQTLDLGNVALLHATSFVLGVLALLAFRVVLARVVPDPGRAWELDLLTVAAAVHPVVLSTLLQPNIDFGVYAFFLLTLAGVLSPGRAGTLLALVAGTGLVFSKETGVAAYALAVALALVVPGGSGVRGALVRRAAVLSLPLLLFAAHVLVWNATHAEGAIWKHGWQRSTTEGFRFFDLSDPVFMAYAAGLFVLGFAWGPWSVVALDALAGLRGMVRRRSPRAVPGCDPRLAAGITVVTVVLTYLLTAFRTWSNVRYFAVLVPLFLLMAYLAMTRLGWGATARRGVLAGWIALFVVADLWSVDPLSRAVYGTFGTGSGTMYRMASITQEYPGPGRDQLVYNLQFTALHALQDALFDRVRPGRDTVVATTAAVHWNLWSPLDRATGHRTLRRQGSFLPAYADEVTVQAQRPPVVWFARFPNAPDDDRALRTLRATYAVTDSVTVEARGQRLTAYRLVRR